MERQDGAAKVGEGGHGAGPVRAVVVTGVSGSGKSTIGKLLAPALGATFVEGDDYHPSSNVAKMRSGTPLTDNDRAPWLDTLGQVVGEHCRGGQSVVLACSALRRRYRDALARAACRELVFVHLAMTPAVLETRIKGRKQHFMPPSLLQSQLDTLEPLEADEDGITLVEDGTTQETVEAIQTWLRRHARDERA